MYFEFELAVLISLSGLVALLYYWVLQSRLSAIELPDSVYLLQMF